MKILRFALIFNSAFSFATGLTLALQGYAIAEIFGVDETPVFTLLGIGLLAFSIAVFAVSRQKPVQTLAVLVIIILDLVWVLSSIPLLLLNPFEFTQTGNIIVGAVALVVFLAALMQSTGLSKVDSNDTTGYKELKFERSVNANTQTVWDVISDVANYHHVAPNIDDVKIISGNGTGMVRECSQGDGRWTEECILWNEGEQFSFKVNTDAPDYPFPLSFLQGTWEVTPHGANQSKIEMKFEFKYKRNILNVLLHPLMAPKFRSIVKELMDKWEEKIMAEGK